MSGVSDFFNRRCSARIAIPGALLIAGLGAATWVRAVESVNLNVASIEGLGWSARDVQIALELPERTHAVARIGHLKVDAANQELHDLTLHCRNLDIGAREIVCGEVRIAGDFGPAGRQDVKGTLRYGRADGALAIDMHGLKLGGGTASLAATLDTAGWRGRARLDRVVIEPLLKLGQQLEVLPAGYSATGVLSGRIEARGIDTSPQKIEADLTVQELTANNEEGTLATDKLGVALQMSATQRRGDWSFDAKVRSSTGQAYAEPIFMDFGAHAIDARAMGEWKADGQLAIDQFQLDHAQVARAQGRATLMLEAEQPLQLLQLKLDSLQFPGAYETYFQPMLLDTNFKSLQTSGAISGELSLREGAPEQIHLNFADVSLDDGQRALVLAGLSGDWHWSAQQAEDDSDDPEAEGQAANADSHLRWSSGTLLNLDLGAARLDFNTHGHQFRLLEPVSVPLLDGAIELESFRVRNLGKPSVAFMVDATIRPISVAQLCQAFGWPEFGGSIGGKISKLRMRDNVITLGTVLEAQVFDGSLRISDLRLEQPFSQWPRFAANIAFTNLDLNLVTSAFSFGGITGRLSGEIDGLKLFNWSPVAFDARLYTPPDDRSRHRISQRAVQNIGSIGGGGAGVTAALSSGVMKFFDDFNYDRLGLSCRLENEVCHLDGIAPAPNGGYYLVKGKGIPRIDVIGSAHRVDWPRLVQQLIAVTDSEGPVVQ